MLEEFKYCFNTNSKAIKLILSNENIKTITNFNQPINERYKNKFVPKSYYSTIKYKK